MKKSKTFENVLVWQKGHQFVLEVSKIIKLFLKEEIYGFTSPFRKAAVSIPANIDEVYKKVRTKEKVFFYNIAQASLEESNDFLILSRDLEYTNQFINLNDLISKVSKMLNASLAAS
jgi:four helix bundle protein